ncbi:hypothetical protein GGF42_002700 [Coemansia sp. RSA 2424]|nr:hypothetical protein GGF42_002700 [Coemansia sp. RSA 2424]
MLISGAKSREEASVVSSDLAATDDGQASGSEIGVVKRTYQVEAIANDLLIDSVHRFEVKWVGFGREQNSWLTEDELRPYGDILNKYKQAQEENTADLRMFKRLLADADGLPISVVNKVDCIGCPKELTYINENIYSDEVPRPCTPMFWCECTNGCRSDCECSSASNYDSCGLLKAAVKERIVECGPLCKCADNCVNRVVQRGSKVEFEIRRYAQKGWGVVTKKLLEKGTFVAEYVGEVISTDEAERRGLKDVTNGLTYLYDLDKEFTSDIADFSIDAKTHGNISRFFNHSCNPNMKTFAVYIEHRDPRLHRLAIFTTRVVKAGDELTIDYSPGADIGEGLHLEKCYCGAPKCRGYMC